VAALVKMVMKTQVPHHAGKFLSSCLQLLASEDGHVVSSLALLIKKFPVMELESSSL
jgi:hypothetical protein